MKRTRLLFLFSLFLTTLSAQKYTISGYISDEENGEKLIAANVLDQNSLAGTVTNTYGFFSLTLPKDSVTLSFSYIGYQPKEIKLYLEVPAHESNLAITAHLTNLDEFSLVHVTRTVGILDNQDAEPIKDAKVELYSEGQLIQTYEYRELYEEPNQNGNTVIRDLYVVENAKPLTINKTYELRVTSPTHGEIIATQPLLAPILINSGTYEENGISGIFEDIETNGAEDDRAEEIAIKFQDVAGEKNYYAVQATGFYEHGNDEYVEPFYLSPVDPSTEEGLNSLILSDAAFDGKEYELKMAAFGETEGLKRIEVILYSITEDRYLYELSLLNYEENDGNPFAEPVIIHENVTDGNGIFTLSSGSAFSIEI